MKKYFVGLLFNIFICSMTSPMFAETQYVRLNIGKDSNGSTVSIGVAEKADADWDSATTMQQQLSQLNWEDMKFLSGATCKEGTAFSSGTAIAAAIAVAVAFNGFCNQGINTNACGNGEVSFCVPCKQISSLDTDDVCLGVTVDSGESIPKDANLGVTQCSTSGHQTANKLRDKCQCVTGYYYNNSDHKCYKCDASTPTTLGRTDLQSKPFVCTGDINTPLLDCSALSTATTDYFNIKYVNDSNAEISNLDGSNWNNYEYKSSQNYDKCIATEFNCKPGSPCVKCQKGSYVSSVSVPGVGDLDSVSFVALRVYTFGDGWESMGPACFLKQDMEQTYENMRIFNSGSGNMTCCKSSGSWINEDGCAVGDVETYSAGLSISYRKDDINTMNDVKCAKCPDNGTTDNASNYYYTTDTNGNVMVTYLHFNTIADCYKKEFTDETGTFVLGDYGNSTCYYSGE